MIRSLILLASVAFFTIATPVANPIAAERIGLILPLEGRLAPVGKRMNAGAKNALKGNSNLKVQTISGGCNLETVVADANKLLSQNVEIVVGPVCFKYASALAKAMNTRNRTTPVIPVVTVNTRNNGLKRLREVDELPLYSVSNAHDAEAQAVVRQILPRFEGRPYALIDDGSVYGRSLADDIRLLAEQAGLKPTIAVNYRPLQTTQISLLRRLNQSGIEALFVAGGPQDVVTIAKDMKTLGLNWTIATGEQAELLPFTENAQEVPAGLLMVEATLPNVDLKPELVELLSDENGELTSDTLIGHALVEIAIQAGDDLTKSSFKTILGEQRFDPGGRSTVMPMTLFEWDGGVFKKINTEGLQGN